MVEKRTAKQTVPQEFDKSYHPFLVLMQPYFPQEKFAQFLQITRERLGTLNPDGKVAIYLDQRDQPTGRIPQEHDTLSKARDLWYQLKESGWTEDDLTEAYASFLFAIWAHGTNPDVKKRNRHTGEPYAMHVLRTAERVLPFGKETVMAATIHDVIEDTLYRQKDIKDLFGERIAHLVSKVTKISTDSLEQLSNVEVGVARMFLSLFKEREEVAQTIEYIDQAVFWSGLLKRPISQLEPRQPILPVLSQLMTSEEEVNLLTMMQLLSTIEDEDDILVLIIKAADVADNSQTYPALAQAKSAERALLKAKMADSIFAPLTQILGIDKIAREIQANCFPILYPEKAGRISKRVTYLATPKYEQELKSAFDNLIKRFRLWAETVSAVRYPREAMAISVRQPTFAEIDRLAISQDRPVSPLIEIKVNDRFVLAAFRDFLLNSAWLESLRIEHEGIEPTYDEKTGIIRFRIKVLNHRRLIYAFLRDGSGDIADIFKSQASAIAKANGRERLARLQKNFATGDFSDFINYLAKGYKPVYIIVAIGGAPQSMKTPRFVPQDANLYDVLVLAGYPGSHGQVIRAGQPISADTTIHPSDTVVIERSDKRPTAPLFDLLATPQARKELLQELQTVPPEERERVRKSVLRRGIKIATVLSDCYLCQKEYPIKGGRAVIPGELGDDFWQEFFEKHRDLLIADDLIDDEFFINLGMTSLRFPPRYEFTVSQYDQWMKTTEAATKLEQILSWMEKNCLEVWLTGQTAENSLLVYQYLGKIANPITVVGWKIEPGYQPRRTRDTEWIHYQVYQKGEEITIPPVGERQWHQYTIISRESMQIVRRVLYFSPYTTVPHIYVAIDPRALTKLGNYLYPGRDEEETRELTIKYLFEHGSSQAQIHFDKP